MAEGDDFSYEDKDLDYHIDHDDDDDQEVNRTGPFDPYTASTPYHDGEQHEMQTWMQEQSGLPDTSYEETPFLRRTGSITDLQQESTIRRKMKRAVDMVKAKFPRANFEIMKIRRGTGKNSGKIVAIGTRGGEYKILKDDESDLTKSFIQIRQLQNKTWPKS